MPTRQRRYRVPICIGALIVSISLGLSAGQDPRAILLRPGSVNTSIAGSLWWLANSSLVATWDTSGEGIRLSSPYDRQGGRTGTKAGEAFTIALPDGRRVKGSELKLIGTPSVEELGPDSTTARPLTSRRGLRLAASFESADGTLRVRWRAELWEGADSAHQDVSIEKGAGTPVASEIGYAGQPPGQQSIGQGPGVRILAGPYLQNPGPTSITVMWVTDGDAAGWVEYGPSLRTAIESPKRVVPVHDGLVEAGVRIHRVTLDGLSPDTAYFYRTVTRPITAFGPYKVDYGEAIHTEIVRVRTLGATRRTFSFLVFNDLHEDVGSMRAHMERQAQTPVDLVFFNGDSLSHLESETQIIERCLKPAADLFARGVPLLMVRGNHETRGAFARQLRSYLALPDGRFYYTLDHGPVHFIVMDTGEDKEDSHWAYSGLTDFDAYRKAEADWLRQEVRTPAFQNARFRILIAHMPFFGNERTRVTGHGPTNCRENWGTILNEAGIDLHIAGHTHRTDWVEPAVGANRFPISVGGGSQRGTNTLTRVDVSPDRLAITVTTDDGKVVANRTVKARQ